MTTTAIKERPILFSGPMVQSILEGRKTQTRRVIKWKVREPGLNLGFSGLDAGAYANDDHSTGWVLRSRDGRGTWNDRTYPLNCPYGLVGDRLWVRETWSIDGSPEEIRVKVEDALHRGEHGPYYAADDPQNKGGHIWRPSIHMPRWASRLMLEVEDVRVQRLQYITPFDAKAEGAKEFSGMPEYHERGEACYVDWYRNVWNLINGKRGFGWDANPWVWAVTFKVLS